MNDRLFPGLHVARGQPQRQRLLFLELSVLIIKATQCLQRKSGKKVGASHCLKEKVKQTNPSAAAPVLPQLASQKAGECQFPGIWGIYSLGKAWGTSFLTSGAGFSNSLTSCCFNSGGYIQELSGEGGRVQGDGKGDPQLQWAPSHSQECVRLRPGRKILNP